MVTTSLPIPSCSSLSPNFIFFFKPQLSKSLAIPITSKPLPLFPLKTTRCRRISATHQNFSIAEANLVESSNTEQIVASTDDGVSTIISVLLFVAFIGLSVLTIGVIYIAVTDYLQKREKEKFEKEEATNKKKKGGKKRKVRVRAGPKGFGQKIVDDSDDDFIDV